MPLCRKAKGIFFCKLVQGLDGFLCKKLHFFIFVQTIQNKLMHSNLKLKIQIIQELTQQWYEPGRQDRSYKWIWRNKIYPLYPCCYRTFMNYINTGNVRG